NAPGEQHPDVRLGSRWQRVDRCLRPCKHLLVGVGDAERDTRGRFAKTPLMRAEQKRTAAVGAKHLINAVAEEKSVIENRNDRILLSTDAAINVHDCRHADAPTGNSDGTVKSRIENLELRF